MLVASLVPADALAEALDETQELAALEADEQGDDAAPQDDVAQQEEAAPQDDAAPEDDTAP